MKSILLFVLLTYSYFCTSQYVKQPIEITKVVPELVRIRDVHRRYLRILETMNYQILNMDAALDSWSILMFDQNRFIHDCGDSWIRNNNSCYKVVKETMTYIESKGNCTDEDAILLDIVSEQLDPKFIASLLESDKQYWVDGQDVIWTKDGSGTVYRASTNEEGSGECSDMSDGFKTSTDCDSITFDLSTSTEDNYYSICTREMRYLFRP